MYTKTFPWRDSQVKNVAWFFERLRTGTNDVLLESTMMGEHGRFSYIALDPETVIKSKGEDVFIDGIRTPINPLVAIQKELAKDNSTRPKGFPLFYGGAIGYLGYDIKNSIEPKLRTTTVQDTHFPDSYFVFPSVVIAFDHVENTIFIFAEDDSHRTMPMLETLLTMEEPSVKDSFSPLRREDINISTNVSFTEYEQLFERAKEYVRSGDTYQVKLSIRHDFPALFDAWTMYKKLRKSNPSPYAAFLDLEGVTLISCSPEELLRLEGRIAETRPIGGTYKRGTTAEDDVAIAKSFFEDEKEFSEHVMLIDLERNDIGKVSVPGSVKVVEKMALEKYSNLMHIVTTILGRLDTGKTVFDLLSSMFPGGTVTGCPKIRAMEIIDELEPVARGPYTGSIGFITPADECQFNIIIRTIAIDKTTRRGYIQVGGGIVADSTAEYEYQENLRKGKALVDAICI